MADSEDFHILCLHETHANATKVDSALECESSSDGTVSNKTTVDYGNGPGLYTFVRYYVSVRTNRLAKEVHIDWGDTQAESKGRRTNEGNIEILKSDLPTSVWVTSHIFTRAGTVRPMVRTKGIDGFLSKWYVNNETRGLNATGISPYYNVVSDYQNDQNSFSVVSTVSNSNPSMPYFLMATQPPTAVLKGDKKRIKSGIENLWLGQGHGVSSGTQLRDGSGAALTNSGTAFSSGATIYAEVTTRARSAPTRRSGVQVKVTYKDITNKQVNLKTLTCDGGGTNNKITGVAEVLKIELVNLKENSDTYMNTTGTGDTTLAPGERVFLYANITDSSSNNLMSDTSQEFHQTDNAIGFVSTGNPIMSLDDPETILNCDFSESKVREWNIDLSYFYFDDDKLHPMKRTSQVQRRIPVSNVDKNYITDQLNNNVDTKYAASKTTHSVRYGLSRNQDFLDSDYRFFSTKRLFRLQAEHSYDNTSNGSYQKYSPLVSFRDRADSSDTVGTDSDFSKDSYVPDSFKQWTYGALLLNKNPGHGTSTAPDWHNMVGYNCKGQWPLMTFADSMTICDSSLDTTSGSATCTVDDTDGFRVGQNITSGASGTIQSIDSIVQFTATSGSGGTATNTTLKLDGDNYLTKSSGTSIETDPLLNWVFVAHRKKFDRIFWRTTHKRNYFDNDNSSSTVDYTNPLNIGTNFPKVNVQIFYPARKAGGTHDDIIFKPLAFIDGTADPNSDYSSFVRSGEMMWDYPTDWIKTKHGSDVVYPVNNTNFAHDSANDDGINDHWTEDSWALLIGINVENTTIDSGAHAFWNINRMLPYNNSHSLMVEIEDPMHISLNDRAIASSVSYVRKGTWQSIKNKLGMAELRRIGAEGGKIKLGGVDLRSATDREKFQDYQKNAKPVYYDIEHIGDNTTTRVFGYITDMAEDIPTAKVHPKFTCTLDITKTIEFNTSTGAMISDGYISLGGELGGKAKYVSGS